MNFPPPTPGERRMLDALARLVLSEDPPADDDAYAMAVEYVHLVNESSTSRYPQPLWSAEFTPIEGQRRQSLGPPSSRESTGNPNHGDHFSSTYNADRSYRRQSLQLASSRRASLVAEVEQRTRRSSLPNPTFKVPKPQQGRVVGNGVYKLETLPWHESSLRQAIARRAHEKKEQLASPLPLINFRPEAEARLRVVLGEDGYAEWRQRHRSSYLLNEG